MTYKTILVHANDERRFARLAAAAAELARSQGAHLIGLAAMPQIPATAFDPGQAALTMLDTERQIFQTLAANLKAQFDAATADAAAHGYSAEWRTAGTGFETVRDLVVAQGQTVDLVMVCQTDFEWPGSPRFDVPELLALECGRPVLIIPNKGGKPFASRRVLVAWNATREASRAVFDALPLLANADEVELLWLAPPDIAPESADQALAGITATLARHGTRCAVLRPTREPWAAGETILGEVERTRCDLLVMGCYGHSRLREFIVGGASRHVLGEMTVPVLMSH